MLIRKSIVLLSFLFIFFAVTLMAQAQFIPAETNVTFEGPDGVTLRGYLAMPDTGETGEGARLPGVLMIHEWWGLNRDIARLAEALATNGYVVLAPDAFRGNLATTAEEALRQVLNTPSEQVAGDLAAALEYLRSRPEVDPERVGVLGFCFGGTQAMLLATSHPELNAVVIFYGTNLITDPERLGSIPQAGPVLGIFGEEDNNIPVEQVRAFEEALEARGVEHTIVIYPGVGHAFVSSENYNAGGTPEEAWNRMVQFLEENLK